MALQLLYQPHQVISYDKGPIAAPNKKWRQWDVRQVLPIVAIFAECSTRRPSPKKLVSGAEGNNEFRELKEIREFSD